MQYAVVKNGEPELITGPFSDGNGVQHSDSILTIWSLEELSRIGVYPVAESVVYDGFVATGYTLSYFDGMVEKTYIVEPVDVNSLKPPILASIDSDAEIARQKYITRGAGQAMTYQSKVAEAIRYHETNGQGDYPFLNEEVGITGDTLAEVAATILTMHHEWQIIGGQIERERLAAKKAVELATTVTELNNIKPVWP